MTVLDTANFTDWVLSRSLTLIEFYSPKCGYCKRLAPEYEKAAKKLAALDDPIDLAKVDAVKEERLASKFDIAMFPTLIVFRRSERFEYTGGKTADGDLIFDFFFHII